MWGNNNTSRMDGESVRFNSGSPFFVVGEEIFQLPNPTYVSGRHLMIPASWALDWLPAARPRQWSYMDGRLVERPTVTVRPPGRPRFRIRPRMSLEFGSSSVRRH